MIFVLFWVKSSRGIADGHVCKKDLTQHGYTSSNNRTFKNPQCFKSWPKQLKSSNYPQFLMDVKMKIPPPHNFHCLWRLLPSPAWDVSKCEIYLFPCSSRLGEANRTELNDKWSIVRCFSPPGGVRQMPQEQRRPESSACSYLFFGGDRVSVSPRGCSDRRAGKRVGEGFKNHSPPRKQ